MTSLFFFLLLIFIRRQNHFSDDRLLLTLDITQDKDTTEMAYMDPSGIIFDCVRFDSFLSVLFLSLDYVLLGSARKKN